MAEFSEYLYKLKPLAEMNVNMEELKQLPLQNPSLSESFSASDFSVDSFLSYQLQTDQQQQQKEPEFSESYYSYINDHQSSTFCSDMILSSSPVFNTKMGSNQIGFAESKKRKTVERSSTCCSSKNISSLAASTNNTNEKNGVRICKKGKSKDKETKAEEIIHVRAKRGQATDSHSIAERVRRERINNKLRCLQDLVPGCHKSMGMAVMLEEIINYVHSLQNQVEFLSMELAAASNSYGLNLESSEKHQGTYSGDGQEMQKWRRQRFGELNCYHSPWSI